MVKKDLQEIRSLMWSLYVIKSEKKTLKNKNAEREAELTQYINNKIKEYNKTVDSKKAALATIYLDYTDTKMLNVIQAVDLKLEKMIK